MINKMHDCEHIVDDVEKQWLYHAYMELWTLVQDEMLILKRANLPTLLTEML